MSTEQKLRVQPLWPVEILFHPDPFCSFLHFGGQSGGHFYYFFRKVAALGSKLSEAAFLKGSQEQMQMLNQGS